MARTIAFVSAHSVHGAVQEKGGGRRISEGNYPQSRERLERYREKKDAASTSLIGSAGARIVKPSGDRKGPEPENRKEAAQSQK